SDGEVHTNIEESIGGSDCSVIQSTSGRVNEDIMEVVIMVDGVKGGCGKRVNIVIGY
uniref:ribose-phosphate pyrophosphokinase-like domain-containing protein n=1 Tax=Bacillus pumilus TaxID=1408 RepID=UPI00119E2FFF